MLCVGLLLSSDEWQRIQQAAAEQFPGKVLSRAEIVRRYTLAGIEALAELNAEEPIHDDPDADLAVSVLRVCALRSGPGAAGQRAAGVLQVRAGLHAGEGGEQSDDWFQGLVFAGQGWIGSNHRLPYDIRC
jgi:hypothetical protein